jgi:phenylpyruvate tautomerase PptA (4-oxalocrotonate tautomerase family)
MPYFRVSVSKRLSPEEAEEITQGLGIALEQVPGKTRHMLILNLEDGQRITIGGTKLDNVVFADLHYCGKYTYAVKCNLTEAVFEVFAKTLDSKPEHMSLTITEHHNWGGFGNFHDDYY